ncbi:MAG: glucose-1-phosphate thymidylyltransferase [Chloroflexi bacterium]|nr:MAG: glucose-1-phosphate thymidylyltransferase [Chloroflexota bacterium]
MRGIILAGGSGTRLHPSTLSVSKQLLPVYDKPMVYYPLSTLMLAGVREVLIISNPEHLDAYRALLGEGSVWGMRFAYVSQSSPRGLADAFILGEDFIDNEPVALMLGDNILYGSGLVEKLRSAAEIKRGAVIFAYLVKDPERFGIVELDHEQKPVSLEEKPSQPKSNYAVPGVYFYDAKVVEYAKSLKPSKRGEIEITDLNRIYLAQKELEVKVLGRGVAWLDAGTPEALLQAANFIQAVQDRQGFKISCPEEIAYRMKFIDRQQLAHIKDECKNPDYKQYLDDLIVETTIE